MDLCLVTSKKKIVDDFGKLRMSTDLKNNQEYYIINQDSFLSSLNSFDFSEKYLSNNLPVIVAEDSSISIDNIFSKTMNINEKIDNKQSNICDQKSKFKPTSMPRGFEKPYPQSLLHDSSIIMKYRNIGKNGLRVPVMAFSAWNSLNHVPEETAENILTAAYENGINYFDTGDAFGSGNSEFILGKILKKKNWPRNSYIISTKIFWKNGPTVHRGGGLSRKFIIEAVEASLNRLQLKYIDILIIHKLDAMCPMEEIVRTMSYLINNGIIFYWGTSRFSPMHISESFYISRQYNCPPLICEQMEYHMFSRDKMELQMLELFHKSGIGCIIWSPISMQLDEGISFITTKQNKMASSKFDELSKLCEKLGCDLIQLSLAWCLQNENVNSILITATTLAEFYQKLNAIKIYSILTETVNNEIETILDNNPVIKRQSHKTPSISVDIINE